MLGGNCSRDSRRLERPERLFRLFYRSRLTGAAGADSVHVVEQIIGTSIRPNRTAGVTGLLPVVQGHCIQALEGNIDAVGATYARIATDPRHQDLQIISQGPAEKRLFGQWRLLTTVADIQRRAALAALNG